MISAIEKITNVCTPFTAILEKLTWKVVCLTVPIMFMKCDALSVYSILSIQLSCFPVVSSLFHNITFYFVFSYVVHGSQFSNVRLLI